MSCLFFTVPLVSLQSAIVTFPGHTHFLVNIVFFSSLIKYFYWQKEPKLAGKYIQIKTMAVCCYICYGLTLHIHLV